MLTFPIFLNFFQVEQVNFCNIAKVENVDCSNMLYVPNLFNLCKVEKVSFCSIQMLKMLTFPTFGTLIRLKSLIVPTS